MPVADREFLFVLEDLEKKRIVGTSMIYAQHGTKRAPHIFFRVENDERYSVTLDRHFIHQTLRIGYNYNGPTEIGGLILLPEYRHHAEGLGKALSYVRFVFIRMHRAWFRHQVLSELLPPLEADGTSQLWEHLGRRFTGLSYQEADHLSKDNKEFIHALFPDDPIHTELLPDVVRDIIGKVGPDTQPVEKMLRRIGFDYAEQIDPFDGGPHFMARTDDITLVRDARQLTARTIGEVDSGAAVGDPRGRSSRQAGVSRDRRARDPDGRRQRRDHRGHADAARHRGGPAGMAELRLIAAPDRAGGERRGACARRCAAASGADAAAPGGLEGAAESRGRARRPARSRGRRRSRRPEAWGDPGRGCFAAWLALRGGGAATADATASRASPARRARRRGRPAARTDARVRARAVSPAGCARRSTATRCARSPASATVASRPHAPPRARRWWAEAMRRWPLGRAACSAAVAHASPTPMVHAPDGWRADAEQAAAIAKAAGAAVPFGDPAATVAAEVYAPENDPRISLVVTRAATREQKLDRGAAAAAAIEDVHGASARAKLSGAKPVEDAWEKGHLGDDLTIEVALGGHDAGRGHAEDVRIVIAADAATLVAVTGECLAAGERPAGHRGRVQGRAGFARHRHRAGGSRRRSRRRPQPPRRARARARISVCADRRRRGSPRPADRPHERRLAHRAAADGDPAGRAPNDRRPVYVGAGIALLAAAFYWNRRNRERFEPEADKAGHEDKPDDR